MAAVNVVSHGIAGSLERKRGISSKSLEDISLPAIRSHFRRTSPLLDDSSRPVSAGSATRNGSVSFPTTFVDGDGKVPSRSNSYPKARRKEKREENGGFVRSPLAGRKLEPLSQRAMPKPIEKGVQLPMKHPLLRGKTLPAIQTSCPAIIVTDVDTMPRIQTGKQACKLESRSVPEFPQN
eukprot:m.54811 g.54811  ORF g.54811 m.54811 type:complete len:180 (+) comp34405_c0_seq2:3561-4100(+)